MSILDEIVAAKRVEVEQLRTAARARGLHNAAAAAPPRRDFAAALCDPTGRLTVVAEIKRRSPSKGPLAPDLDPAATAAAYEAGGAAALSVLTDGPFFGGSADDLRAARAACGLPVLRKDFTIDELQLDEARAIGADAALLIVAAIPDDGRLAGLHTRADGLGLAVLVEAHDENELDRAVAAGARIVGINARDLGTFAEDLTVAERLAARVPDGVIRVAESAIRTPGDAGRMADAGFDAVLVGEALVRAPDPVAALRDLRGAAVPRDAGA